jgi:2-keto-3-deoxy-L-fuconate dehydrogenase
VSSTPATGLEGRLAGVSDRLAGVTAVVTGGGSGIGRACCLRLAAEGATVLVTDVDIDRARLVAAEVEAGGASAEARRLDVADPDSRSAWSEILTAHPHPIDVLVNNAGVGSAGSVLETDERDWRRLFSVNVDGVFRSMSAVLPSMLARASGSVVNIASVAGLVGLPNRFAYCATKSAVVGMTRATALDFADSGVRINCVCPGTIDTPWVASFADAADDPAAFRSQMDARQPIGRMGRDHEIAAAVAYLASEDSSFMTGSALVVDGGLTAGLPKPSRANGR